MTNHNGDLTQECISIVLADDHNMIRQGIRRLLEDAGGFDIIGEASNGIEAVELVSKLHPEVLITDFKMPGLDGMQVTRQVRESSPDTKVIVLTMYGLETYVYSALSAGASGYVLKSSGVQDLDIAIHEVMQGNIFLSPPITKEAIEAYRIKTNKPPIAL